MGQLKETPNLVVQCPECQTKFGISPSLIEGVDDPRFHCSRCDNIFALPPLRVDASLPLAEQIEVSNSSVISEPPPPPILEEESPPSVLSQPEPAATLEAPASPSAATQTHFPFATPPPQLMSLQEEAEEEQVYRAADQLRSLRSRALDPDIETAPPRSSGWRAVLAISSPLVVFLFVLGGLGVAIRSESLFPNEALQAALPFSPQPPPVGLYIAEAKFRTVTLDSGEEVRLVTGRVVNGSTATVREVLIEANSFDDEGRVISRERVAAATTLSRARVESLNIVTIKSLQEGKSSRRFELKPGGEAPFIVALINERGQMSPRYFSARIYSAR